MSKIVKFIRDKQGVTAAEYALLLALVLLVVAGGAGLLGSSANAKLVATATAVAS